MTQIKVDTIADEAGTGAADFADGITIAGGALSALNTAEYYSSASEPTSPKNGAIWWDTANEKVMVYIADEFKEVELGASAGVLDPSNFTYDSVSFSVSGQETLPTEVNFNADGTKMYIVGYSNDRVYQYSLSTGFDISTASYDNVNFSVGGQASTPRGMRLNNDGTKMYIACQSTQRVYQYSLSTGFDLSTASYDSISLNVSSQTSTAVGITFSNDGTKMYLTTGIGGSVLQYTLSTGFDLSTGSYDNVSFSPSSEEPYPFGISLNANGTEMYIVGIGSDTVYQYTLSTGFDLSTASYDSASFSVASQEDAPQGVIFGLDYTKMYIIGTGSDAVFQYSTGL